MRPAREGVTARERRAAQARCSTERTSTEGTETASQRILTHRRVDGRRRVAVGARHGLQGGKLERGSPERQLLDRHVPAPALARGVVGGRTGGQVVAREQHRVRTESRLDGGLGRSRNVLERRLRARLAVVMQRRERRDGRSRQRLRVEARSGQLRPVTVHRDDDVVERHRHGRVRLVHEHVDRPDDRVVHDDRRDLLRERLDELHRRALDDLDDLLGERRVAQRERQVVARRCTAGIEVHDDVRDEHLPLGALVVEHTVVALRSDARQAHLIERPTVLVGDRAGMWQGHVVLQSRQSWRRADAHRWATRTASTVPGTS